MPFRECLVVLRQVLDQRSKVVQILGVSPRIGLGGRLIVEVENADGHSVQAGLAGHPRPFVPVDEFEPVGHLPHREQPRSLRRPDVVDEFLFITKDRIIRKAGQDMKLQQ